MTATLRALGLTAAAPEAESKHIVAGDTVKSRTYSALGARVFKTLPGAGNRKLLVS